MMRKSIFSALFLMSIFALNITFAQTEDPCVMQPSVGENWEEMLTVICNVCGDGVTDDAEECDDGNTTNGDGCSSSCMGEMALLETGPEGDGSAATGPKQKLPTELLGVGPIEPTVILQNPLAREQINFPAAMQPTGAPRLASLIAARNIEQSQLALAASLGAAEIILPNQLAPTGGTENIVALVMMLLGSAGVRASLKFIK